MSARAVKTQTISPDAEQMLQSMDAARAGTHALITGVSEETMQAVLSPIMSPLAWDLGHIAAYEDLWLAHRHGGMALLAPDLAGLYDAFETPRAVRGEIEALGPREALAYMAEVRERTEEIAERDGIGDGVLFELVLRHELQHCETMRQTMGLAGLLPAGEPTLHAAAAGEGWSTIPAGAFEMGAGPDGFAYDNERPRHTTEVGAFQIARLPVSNESWMHFSEGGGYERREWWSDEGWAWKQDHDITNDHRLATGPAQAPACHVSWFEADAFARAHDARLPTEKEWEKAATWDQADGAEERSGALDAFGQVWEWTSTAFHGYPGFVAHPYREYSEVFFGETYRVLRGGSWATSPRIAGPTFRNWDLPIRRQIFSGVRLAREAG